MNRELLAGLVLLEVAERCEAIRARPKPPAWRTWDVAEDEAGREFGPRYSPKWFDELTDTEAGRVRMLRTVHRLADAGLLTILKSEGGRLERLMLTAEGRTAVNELTTARPSEVATKRL